MSCDEQVAANFDDRAEPAQATPAGGVAKEVPHDGRASATPPSSAATVEPHLMDRMGAWSDYYGVGWFAREHYPTPADMRRFYLAEFDPGIPYIELRVLARHARHAPDHDAAPEFDGEFWVECGRDEPGAFPVWRVE